MDYTSDLATAREVALTAITRVEDVLAYDAADLPLPADVVELEFREGMTVEQG